MGLCLHPSLGGSVLIQRTPIMKKMIRISGIYPFCLLFLMFATLNSCSKDDDEATETKPTVLPIVKGYTDHRGRFFLITFS